MTTDPKVLLDRLVDRLRASDPTVSIEDLSHVESRDDARNVSDTDRESLLEFADELRVRRSETQYHRQLKLMRHNTIMAEEAGDLTATLYSKSDAKRIVGWIHDAYNPENGSRGSSEETNSDYRVALKKFGRLLSDENGDEPPNSMSWIPSGMPSTYDPAPNWADMLEWEEDINPMLDACRSSRDSALVALQMDAGMRSGELHDLRVGAFRDSKYSLKVHIKGKTGERSVDLIPSMPYVRKWLDDHPAETVNDAPLWTTDDSTPRDYHRIAYHTFREVFEHAAERAGVSKPNDPTNLRKSNAAWLAAQSASQTLIEDRQGRKRGSEQIARYVARFGPKAEKMYAELNGLEIDASDQSAKTGPISCPRCDKETPRHKPLCVWCSQALTPTAVEAATDHDDAMFDSVAEADDDDLVDDLRAIREQVADNPKLRAALLGE